MNLKTMRKQTFSDKRYKGQYELEGPFNIDVGRNRFLHGPCVTRCTNGDWITAYQDSLDDPGRQSVIRQKRSQDGGHSWLDEGIIHNECDDGFGARNPALGQTPSGKIIMVIQRVGLKRLGDVRGENIMGSRQLESVDNGQHYQDRGIIDQTIRRGHQGCSTHLVYHNGKMFMPAFHPKGLVVYISENQGGSWDKRIVVAPRDAFNETPYYPTLTVRSDGSLLFVHHLNQAVRCAYRISHDEGETWSPIEYYNDLRLRHPVLSYLGDTLICVGRNMDWWKPALCVSPDEGQTWSDPIDLLPERDAGGGYTALWPDEENARIMVVVSTSGKQLAYQDIVGLFLSDLIVS